MDNTYNSSEVARLRQQIEAELEVMHRCMHGFAAGKARHDFIYSCMEHLGNYQDKLAERVGDTEATYIMYDLYTNVIDK